ncbi:hypothetical protein GF314_05740 [bacterium]|nr:hypothetical protein [bacterium]
MPTHRPSRSARPLARRAALAVSCLALAVLGASAGADTIETISFESRSLDEVRWIQVVLPDGYDPERPGGYPVYYFLHGAGSDHTSYGIVRDVLNGEIATGHVEPAILVKPDDSGCPWGQFTGCNWTNSPDLQGMHEDYVVEDVITEIESRYHTAPGAAGRVILGHSMGGFGAMHIALRHPDVFAGVASHSGYLSFAGLAELHVPRIIAEHGGSGPWQWTPDAGMISALWFLMAGAFSPDPNASPLPVDFPLSPAGTVRPFVFARWFDHDPVTLAQALSPQDAPAIYFDCGTSDEFDFHPLNEAFAVALDDREIPHTWRSFDGAHGDRLAERLVTSLRFLDTAMLHEAVASPEPVAPSTLTLQAAPSPFNPRTTIRFEMPVAGHAGIVVYDLRGSPVEVLVDDVMPPGPHAVDWDGTDTNGRAVPSGHYLVRLETADGMAMRKVALIR